MHKPLELGPIRRLLDDLPTSPAADAIDDLLAEIKRLRENQKEMIREMRRAMDDMGTSSLSHHILRPLVGWKDNV
jgi:hypothetical protein